MRRTGPKRLPEVIGDEFLFYQIPHGPKQGGRQERGKLTREVHGRKIFLNIIVR